MNENKKYIGIIKNKKDDKPLIEFVTDKVMVNGIEITDAKSWEETVQSIIELKRAKDKLQSDYQEAVEKIEELKLDKEDLIQYACDLEDKICNLKGNCKVLGEKSSNQKEEIKRLYKQREKFTRKHEYTKKELQNYKDKVNKAMRVINTQIKSADEHHKCNLRIIKFYLIKGECSVYDLSTEEDYKY